MEAGSHHLPSKRSTELPITGNTKAKFCPCVPRKSKVNLPSAFEGVMDGNTHLWSNFPAEVLILAFSCVQELVDYTRANHQKSHRTQVELVASTRSLCHYTNTKNSRKERKKKKYHTLPLLTSKLAS